MVCDVAVYLGVRIRNGAFCFCVFQRLFLIGNPACRGIVEIAALYTGFFLCIPDKDLCKGKVSFSIHHLGMADK